MIFSSLVQYFFLQFSYFVNFEEVLVFKALDKLITCNIKRKIRNLLQRDIFITIEIVCKQIA